jgi:hypothetical protein
MNKGFTIIEAIVAVTVLTVGVLGSYVFISSFFRYTDLSIDKLTAAYLSQEGVEIVKNIRDGNWIERESWNYGIGVGSWEADYNTIDSFSDDYDGDYINLESSGFYGYGSGASTPFKREIQIYTSSSGAEGVIYASSTVSWENRGNSYSIKTEEKLYNWYE